MSKESPEFEVLLKHVDRAGTRAVDGTEEDAPVAPPEKRLMKPEVMSPQGHPLRRSESGGCKDGSLIAWAWFVGGVFLGVGLTWWITATFF